MKTLIGSIILSFTTNLVFAQCVEQVFHVQGTQVVNEVNITVTSAGTVDVLDYCSGITNPYFIGYTFSNGTSGTGSYTFSFDPPVDGVTLNFGGTSNIVDSGVEEVYLEVNGTHYAMTEVGAVNPCEALAVLTPEGNLGACENCSVSGWNGTTISQTINTLSVVDTVLSGNPAGTVFSLFICDPVVNSIPATHDAGSLLVFPNPASGVVYLRSNLPGSSEIILYDSVSREVKRQTFNLNCELDISTLPAGIYWYKYSNSGSFVSRGEIVVQ